LVQSSWTGFSELHAHFSVRNFVQGSSRAHRILSIFRCLFSQGFFSVASSNSFGLGVDDLESFLMDLFLTLRRDYDVVCP
jgi:hypothetical protein